MKFSIEGLDDLQKKLDELQREIKKLNGEHQIPLHELFPSQFMHMHTNFESIEKMINDSGYIIEKIDDIEKIPDDEWDEYISNKTKFDNWNSMLEKAVAEWASSRLGL